LFEIPEIFIRRKHCGKKKFYHKGLEACLPAGREFAKAHKEFSFLNKS
jgi:hypothetical protein